MGGFAVFEMLFFILLVAVLVGAAYYVGKNHSDKSSKSNAANTKDSSAASRPATSSDWEIYQNSQLGLKFSHPKGWTVGRDNGNGVPEPAIGSEFGDGHTFLGSLGFGPNTGSNAPLTEGNIFGNVTLSFSDIANGGKQEWQNFDPFKSSRSTQEFTLKGGQGIMINQVTADYSDLIFYLKVGGNYYLLSYREQVIANGGPAENNTQYSDDMIKVVKSFESL